MASIPVVRYDWRLIPGDTVSVAFAVKDSTDTAVSLAGASGVCQIRSEAGGELLLSPAVTVTDAATGAFTIASSAASTADLAPGIARYAVRLTLGDATVYTVREGTVSITASVIS
jgi:hypothetical protein